MGMDQAKWRYPSGGSLLAERHAAVFASCCPEPTHHCIDIGLSVLPCCVKGKTYSVDFNLTLILEYLDYKVKKPLGS